VAVKAQKISQGPKVRRLSPQDLLAVVAIDAATSGRTRHFYLERRLKAALAEPELHLQFAAESRGRLVGYVLARKLEGEFGRTEPALRLEAMAVSPGIQGRGVGSALLSALEAGAKKSGIPAIRTQAAWNAQDMMGFLDRAGFQLGHTLVLDCKVHRNQFTPGEGEKALAPEHRRLSSEIDYGMPRQNDFEALARDHADVRSLSSDDIPDIVRIDQRVMDRIRRRYIEHMVGEALKDSDVRVSLTARVDGVVAGYVAARTDYGDFGRPEPVAVLDAIGVDPDYAHQYVGTALLSQLFVNLEALHIERVETIVESENFQLLGFLYKLGFETSQRLNFVKFVT